LNRKLQPQAFTSAEVALARSTISLVVCSVLRSCFTWWGTRKCVEIRSTYPAAGLTEIEKVKELNSVIDGTAQVEQWGRTREQIIEQRRQNK
jgi:hypothetical protein